MNSGGIMPGGGFLRGVLSGTVFSAIIVIALSTAIKPAQEAPVVPYEPAAAFVPPADPVTAAPTFGAPSAAPVVTQAPAAVAPAAPFANAPAPQETASAPVTSAIVAPVMSQSAPAPVVKAPESMENPVVVASAQVVDQPQDAPLVVEEETATSVIAAPVPVGNSGFSGETPATDAAEEPVIETLASNTTAPDVPKPDEPTAIAKADNSTESAPQTTASAAKPAGGFTMTGQSIITPAAEETTETVPAIASDRGGFAQYAKEFTLPEGKPAVSIILLAENSEQIAAIAALSNDISVAVSADNPDVAALVAQYRDLGGESLLFNPNEGGAGIHSGDDPAAAAASITQDLPSSLAVIGIVDGPEGDLPTDPKVLTGVLGSLKETGHGLVTTNSIGLNRTEVMAHEADVPVASILRQVDVQIGKIPVIRQMDKTVLEMGSNDGAVVFGHASDDVLSALKFWLKSSKARRVTIAPVSVVMTMDQS